MIRTHIERKDLISVKLSRKAPCLSHCFFADNAILFFKASEVNCRVVKMISEVYCKALGQMVNLEKSSVFFLVNTFARARNLILACLGIKYFDQVGKYLRLLVIWGRSKSVALAFVRERIGLKLQGWKQKLLSFAGREV